MRWRSWLILAVAALAPHGQADVRDCACDVTRQETLAQRGCSLCRAVEALPPAPAFQVIRDASPAKPHRWLAVPRFHGGNPQVLQQMTPDQRAEYWRVAIAKARAEWGEGWGLAINSLSARTECHLHIHIGKLQGSWEDNRYVTVNGPSEIPLPRENDGLWVHAAGAKLHVHWGNEKPELLLEP